MKYRVVYIDFWKDPMIMEEMTAEDRYFYLYLLTNPNTTSTGIYTISKKQMALELGYSCESVDALMNRFINHHKLIRYNSETRELGLKNWGKYNLAKGGKPVIDCLTKELGLVKDISLIEYIAENIKSEVMLKLYEKFFRPSSASERIVPREVDNKEKEIRTETRTETNTETEKETDTEIHKNKNNTIDFQEENEGIEVNDNYNFSVDLDETTQSLSNYYMNITGSSEGVNLNNLKLLIKQHKPINVKHAIDKAVANDKFSISYINGILKNWEKEGYPKTEEVDGPKLPKQTGKALKFTDYPQRQYDFDDLEKRLLGWDSEN
ncbi:DnaD domain protein [Clostridium sp. YIM B02505]|uniref:DnaD domain protein n=1 Tax=Clostridium yunnanense TaxID=2800325 RepID=A0ABS1ERZ0_9CLOT|nr:DnaD domain protein [Clostridium yunnanense]MBK1812175.1 DnaD domain protein [Clostridium yunnanense]